MKWIMAVALLMSVHVLAQDMTTRGYLTSQGYAGKPTGFVPYIGLGAGYMGYNKNYDVEGAPANALLLGSYYTPGQKGVFDLGYGIATQQFSQTAAPARAIQTGVLEVAGRYQSESRWQTGLVYNTLFDRGNYYDARQADAQLGGVQLLKELNMGSEGLARIGGRYMTGLNTNTAVNTVMIDLQFGWDPGLRRQSMSQQAMLPPPAPTVRTPASEMREKEKMDRSAERHMKHQRKVSKNAVISGDDLFGRKTLQFGVNSAAVRGSDKEMLGRLAKALEENPGLYDKVELIGRADRTGSAQRNMVLSEQRAEAVKSTLISQGLSSDKITTTGVGSRQPASVGMAGKGSPAERRVELRFTGVTDPDELRSVLSKVQ